jgi:hypothetical protein
LILGSAGRLDPSYITTAAAVQGVTGARLDDLLGESAHLLLSEPFISCVNLLIQGFLPGIIELRLDAGISSTLRSDTRVFRRTDRRPPTFAPFYWQAADKITQSVFYDRAREYIEAGGSTALICIDCTDDELAGISGDATDPPHGAAVHIWQRHQGWQKAGDEQSFKRAVETISYRVKATPLFDILERLSYEGTPSLERVLWGSMEPVDLLIAACPPALQDNVERLRRTPSLEIAAASGTGKSVNAMLIGYRFWRWGAGIYRLQIGRLSDRAVGPSGLTDVFYSLKRRRADRGSVLIIDDMHLLSDRGAWLDRARDLARETGVRCILVQSTGSSALPFSVPDPAGESQLMDWPANRTALIAWAQAHTIRPYEVIVELSTALSAWQFFHILRGGTQGFASELAESRLADFADVVWFALCYKYFYSAERGANISELFAFIEVYQLFPLDLLPSEREPWLRRALLFLVETRRIVRADAGRVEPRHLLDASTVLKHLFSWPYDGALTRSYQDILIEGFREYVGEAPISKHQKDALLSGDKHRARTVYREIVGPALTRQARAEMTVGMSPHITQVVKHLWAPLCKVLSQAPIHTLYTIGIDAHLLNDGVLANSPFLHVAKWSSMAEVRRDGDAVDAVAFISAIVGKEGIRQLELYLVPIIRQMSRSTEELAPLTHRRALAGYLQRVLRHGFYLEPLRSESPERIDPALRTVYYATEFLLDLLKRASNSKRAFDSITNAELEAVLGSMQSAAPLLVFHFWLVSRDLAARAYTILGPDQQQELVESAISEDFSSLWVTKDSILFLAFAVWLSKRNLAIAHWLESRGDYSMLWGPVSDLVPILGELLANDEEI